MIFIDKFYKQEYDIEESYPENDNSNISLFRSANVIREVGWTSRYTIAEILIRRILWKTSFILFS
ncbi:MULTISPECIES: hypothetical protein [unclassified Granulicatella]|uniref:hypothetical protein n=1 Tax=unclassified Granulicatella TaxID=2630493 RepID=UPI001073DABE|nr:MULTISPECIES: hypothetical protein [unclassified Granulicatella]MBF0779969.1 hypothetical protein [Granulicatella sp. 19428wC4_WM01]TFU95985.1 hypothetical protein E4T68_02555 [Granulicatella sp. WM01]